MYGCCNCMYTIYVYEQPPPPPSPIIHPDPNSENNLTQNACISVACKSNDYFKHFSELTQSIRFQVDVNCDVKCETLIK